MSDTVATEPSVTEQAAADPELRFFFREEVGHDTKGYPPPTVELALGQLASTRRTLATALPAIPQAVLELTVEIPDLGTMTVAEWTPPIIGHLTQHVDQAVEILTDRGAMPAGDAATRSSTTGSGGA